MYHEHSTPHYTLDDEKEFLTEITDRFRRLQLKYTASQLQDRASTRKHFGNARSFVARYLTGLRYRTKDFVGKSDLSDADRAAIIEFAGSLV